MGTTLTKYDDVTVLTVKDDLSGDELVGFLESAARCQREQLHRLVIDCGAIGSLDSGGLEALADLQDQCEEEFGSVKLCALDETLKKILEITRLLRRFEVFDDLDAAVKSFG
jgi:anti-sigma B factor antagonist